MNKVILMGRLTKNPELRQFESGASSARFSIAVSRRFKNASGTYDADFFNCTAWRKTGEFISQYFHKGDMISIVGTLQNDKWTDEDGRDHISTQIIVDEAYFTGNKNDTTVAVQKPVEDAEASGAFQGDFSDTLQSAEDDDLPF